MKIQPLLPVISLSILCLLLLENSCRKKDSCPQLAAQDIWLTDQEKAACPYDTNVKKVFRFLTADGRSYAEFALVSVKSDTGTYYMTHGDCTVDGSEDTREIELKNAGVTAFIRLSKDFDNTSKPSIEVDMGYTAIYRFNPMAGHADPNYSDSLVFMNQTFRHVYKLVSDFQDTPVLYYSTDDGLIRIEYTTGSKEIFTLKKQ
jgi:hypothetical protein